MPKKSADGRTVKSVENALAIVETLDHLEQAGISEIANELELAKSTVHKHLRTLQECEYVVRKEQDYRLSLRHLKYGKHVLSEVDIVEASQPVIDQIAEETGEAVWTAIEEHGRAVHVAKALGKRAVPSRGGVGERIDIHSSAIGKALLAGLSDDRIDQIIERHGLPAMTQNTITDRAALFEEIEEIRKINVAFNDSESLGGLRAVASPVEHDGELKGAIALVATENRMQGDYYREELPDLIRGAANEIELRLAYS